MSQRWREKLPLSGPLLRLSNTLRPFFSGWPGGVITRRTELRSPFRCVLSQLMQRKMLGIIFKSQNFSVILLFLCTGVILDSEVNCNGALLEFMPIICTLRPPDGRTTFLSSPSPSLLPPSLPSLPFTLSPLSSSPPSAAEPGC